MSLDADTIVDRRRMRRKLTFWRVCAIILAIGAVVAAGAALRTPGTEAWVGSPAGSIARITITGLIRNDMQRVEALERLGKSRVQAVIVNRVKEGSIAVRWRSRVGAVTPTHVEVASEIGGTAELIPADAVLAMTGYHADTTLLQRLGVPVDPSSGVPAHDESSMVTPVPGCYLAGVIASGNDANRLFIENARGHGELIVQHLLRSRSGAIPAPSRSGDPISASLR